MTNKTAHSSAPVHPNIVHALPALGVDLRAQPAASQRFCRMQPRDTKPLRGDEIQARNYGQTYLGLAQSYRERGDIPNAASCCLEGLALIFGVPRPLVIRDQLHDLLSALDPGGHLSSRLQVAAASSASRPVKRASSVARSSRMTFLERAVSVHQLLNYPCEYERFNRTYEDALACLEDSPAGTEFYIVQHRPWPDCPGSFGGLYFSFVPASLISANGPYYLTDICAVVRK